MHRIVVVFFAALAVWLSAPSASAQTRPAEPPRVVPVDEIKLDESGTLKAALTESRMSAILAKFALLQRQAQDLQQEMTKALDERKKLLDDAAKRARVELREPNEWVYDEAGQRYVRARKTP